MEVGDLIWVRSKQLKNKLAEDLWLPAVVSEVNNTDSRNWKYNLDVQGKNVNLTLPAGAKESPDVQPRNITTQPDLENFVDLPHLNEPEIVVNLKARFERNLIFTYTGPILLTINPSNEIIPAISCERLMLQFVTQIRNDVSKEIVKAQQNHSVPNKHSILISGESGSGKSETFKIILKSFGHKQGNELDDNYGEVFTKWFDQLIVANQVLESFGNAKTERTSNSTRFGKLLGLEIDSNGQLVKSTIRTYLLESARTSSQQASERNFNIFYELLAGMSLIANTSASEWQSLQKQYNINTGSFQFLSKLKTHSKQAWSVLQVAEKYYYMNQQQPDHVVSADGDASTAASATASRRQHIEQQEHDCIRFFELFQSLHQLNIDIETMLSLFDIVLAIVFLGEIRFMALNDASDGCEIIAQEGEIDALALVAELLGVSSMALTKLMTTKTISATRAENIERKLSVANAIIARDAIARALYKNVFDYVVLIMNQQLHTTAQDMGITHPTTPQQKGLTNEVYVLDLFGFDSFTINSLEQLCINYANETLQQIFNHHIFKLELALYQAEGIVFDAAIFSDNKDNVDLIANYIFPVVDDQCRIPNPTDKRLVAQLYRDLQSNSLFSANTNQQLLSKFTIQHFAGQVEYSTENFIVKNTDNLPTDTSKVLAMSSNALLPQLFTSAVNAGKSRNTNNQVAPSFVAQVRSDLQLLTKEIEPTIAHYVRCIKPFHEEDSNVAAMAVSSSGIQREDSHSDVEDDSRPSPSLAMSAKKLSSKGKKSPKKVVRFDQNKVAEQLQYSGVLSALQTNKTGFRSYQSFADFYQRYRIIAANMNFPSDEMIPKASCPAFLPKNLSEEEIKALCEEVVRCMAMPMKYLRSDIYSKILTFKDEKNRYNGESLLIDDKQVIFGYTKIFLHKKEYDQLETMRNLHLLSDTTLVQRHFRKFLCRREFLAKRSGCKVLNRMVRGFLARLRVKKLRAQILIAYTLQRRVRKFLFYCKIVRIQSAYRCFKARAQAVLLRIRREQLLTLYGPMIQSREMRLTRRRNHQVHHLQHQLQLVNGTPMELKMIPSADQRNRKYREEEDLLNKEILELIADSKLSDDLQEGMTDFKKMLNSLFALAQALDTSPLLPTLHSKVKIELITFLKKCKRAEHLLKEKNVIEHNWVRRILGASWSCGFSNAAALSTNLDYTTTSTTLDTQHPIFSRIWKTISALETLKAHVNEEVKLLEDQRQQLRLHGNANSNGNVGMAISSKSKSDPTGSTDDLIAEVNTQLHYLRKIGVLCDNLPQYYRQYITNFCQEYHQDSNFGRAFGRDEEYLEGLLGVVMTSKKLPIIKPQLSDANQQYTQHSLQAMYAPMQQCPLRVEWKETNDLVDQEMSTLNQVKDMAMGDILRTITLLELKKREFQIENLRVLEVKGVGYQFNPTTPGIGFAINSMQHLLGGHCVNARRLIRLTKSGNGSKTSVGSKVTYYQACSTMKKNTLLDVLYQPVAVEQLDTTTFSTTFLSCCLFGLTHVQPNHLFTALDKSKSSFSFGTANSSPSIKNSSGGKNRAPFQRSMSVQKSFKFSRSASVRAPLNRNNSMMMGGPNPLDNLTIKLTGFNPDANFINMFLDYDDDEENRKSIHAMNMNVLFFLPQMDEPLDHDVKQLLIGSPFKIEEIIGSWLRDMHEQNMRYQHLQSIGFAEEDLKSLQLPIKLSHGAVLEVYKRLQFISQMLRDTEEKKSEKQVTLDEILSIFYPHLAEFYRTLRLGSDFTEGTDLKGVTSYAFIYHQALDKEREKYAQLVALTSRSEDSGDAVADERRSSMSASNNSILAKTFKNRRVSKVDEINANLSVKLQSQSVDIYDKNDGSRKLELSNEEKSSKEPRIKRGSNALQLGRKPTSNASENPRILREYSKRFTPSESFNFDNVYANEGGNTDIVKGGPKMDMLAVDEVKYEAPPTPFRKTNDKLVLKRLTMSSKHFGFTGSFGGDKSKTKEKKDVEGTDNMDYDAVYGSLEVGSSQLTNNDEANNFRHQIRPSKRPSTIIPPTSLASPSLDEGHGSPGLSTKRSMASPMSTSFRVNHMVSLTETLESEGLEFLTSLDWRLFLPSTDSTTPSNKPYPTQFGTREQAVVFCSSLGKNFTFLPMLWLNFINEWQLKAFFQYWLRLIRSKELDKSRVKLFTTELVIRFDAVEDMEALKDASILLKLRRKLNIDIKFAILSIEDKAEEDKNEDDEAFDIYAFDATYENEHLHYESDDDHDDYDHLMTAEDKELRRQLLKVLWTCSNLTCGEDIDQVEREVIVVKTMIMQLTSGNFRQFPSQLYPMLDEETIDDFIPILLSYPALAKIGEEVAKCKGFSKHLLIIHQLLAHSLVDRYIPVILMILKHHAEALWLIDPSQGYLPCDRMKKLPENKFWKYKTFANIINSAGELSLPFIRKHCNSASNFGSIVSKYSGEEELIMLAARYQIKCVDVELRTKRFNFFKRYTTPGDAEVGRKAEESLLWRLLISECHADEDDQDTRDAAWYVYNVFIRVVKERMTYANGGFTSQSATEMILTSLDVDRVDKDCIQYYNLSDHVLATSRIMEDIRLFWFPKYQGDNINISSTSATVFFHKKSLGKHLLLNENMS